jgi:Fic-DOC domain mobile mystery protein B
MTMEIEYAPGATPLDPEEIDGLIPYIATQGQLNECEAANLLKAESWAYSIPSHKNFLTIDFIQLLHRKMFDDTWRWAGSFRVNNKNIGVEFQEIRIELTNLLQDIVSQLEHQSLEIDEIAYRFHHRLVAIHPFSNGNGRHARMMTDLLLVQAGRPRFTWGRQNILKESPTRKQYIEALRKADGHDYSALAIFVRS